MKEIELLAPAKNLEYGKEAILCGADAVYIGAAEFGARYAAGNSVEDIASLVEFAHQYGARVYVTMNTILFEDELESAKKLSLKLCNIGVDAFIVQDMAYLMFDLPIQLHASTQTTAKNIERVKFLEEIGFDRVVLERGLTANQIKDICQNTNTEIEAFVHGAICVSYSGECYMGHIVSGRSGNRGVCSQPCRATYNLYDSKGNKIINQKHLLSVKDFKLSQHIPQMIEMGVKSFKIEGRLKDISYLKNSTLHYRQEIDKYLEKNSNYTRSSVGTTVFEKEIDLNKSFTRGFCDYFWKDSHPQVASFNTAKAIGEEIGEVAKCGKDFFVLKKTAKLNNGDGICFVGSNKEFSGTNINTSDGEKIFPNRMDGIKIGTKIYRNFDIQYSNMITREKAVRKIDTKISLNFTADTLSILCEDCKGIKIEDKIDTRGFETPKNAEKMRSTLIEQFKKSGDTIFNIKEIHINGDLPFIAISMINNIRRNILEKLRNKRLSSHKKLSPTKLKITKTHEGNLTYKANVSNSLAEKLYRECGYTNIERAVEQTGKSMIGKEAMVMRYCIRKELGRCLREGGKNESLYLENGGNFFEITNDCNKCEMKLIYRGKNIF